MSQVVHNVDPADGRTNVDGQSFAAITASSLAGATIDQQWAFEPIEHVRMINAENSRIDAIGGSQDRRLIATT